MAIWTGTDQERPASGRFVRNLALSLSGGALLTVLGASAAHAQDGGAAGTASDGSGAAHSGDATAVGNRSGTTKSQTGTASGTVGDLQVVNQSAAVGNVGVAVADTGGNTARGNTSNNNATTTQTANGGLVGAVNSGTAANASNGTATVSTGDATAIGNQSTTDLSQTSGTTAHGTLGGILVVTQSGLVANAGAGVAHTGGNTANGNESANTAGLVQTANSAGLGLASNTGRASNTSDGLATITTGAASATGNQSDTKVTQSSNGDAGDDPGGALLITQGGAVLNVGIGQADTGNNNATGNTSEQVQGGFVNQTATVSDPVLALIAVASNSAENDNVSDGTASIVTGTATAAGNQSSTDVAQTAEGAADGVVPITQAALVVNGGLAGAGTGGNTARGNDAANISSVSQSASVGSLGTTLAGAAIASNTATAGATSDGSAWITTGDATATGNASGTEIDQTVDPSGLVLNPQLTAVLNLGAAQATTGANGARGNDSTNSVGASQGALVGGAGTLLAGQAIASNSLSLTSGSDGSGSVDTGDAAASGNESNTRVTQTANGSIDGLGLVVTPQVAVVANLGAAEAGTGNADVVGNFSTNNMSNSQSTLVAGGGPGSTYAMGSAIASGTLSATNDSDGSAEIRTGAAKATGNHSSTELVQTSDASVDGLGAVVAPQVGVVVNAGVAQATTGNSGATGNGSSNSGTVGQSASVGVAGPQQDLVVLGPATATASLDRSNASDGHAKIGTGTATAEGNRSATTLAQSQDAEVSALGLIVAPQIGVVANVGAADANTGSNSANGNFSVNSVQVAQTASVAGGVPPYEGIIAGPATAAVQADVANTSDGDACVCTGDAVASGNISSTSLDQDLELTTGTGAIVVVQAGGVLNLGLAGADTGHNTANGNLSNNTAAATQTSTINDALIPLAVVGPQTANVGVSGGNLSNGTAAIGTGKATAIGNESETDVAQAAAIDGGFVVTSLIGGTANAGLGLATTGDNTATGNDSTNTATLTQTADGAGVASSVGEISNESDGTARIGDPDCDEPEEPGKPGLPRTGAELEVQAAVGLMLLLLGFGLTRRSKRVA